MSAPTSSAANGPIKLFVIIVLGVRDPESMLSRERCKVTGMWVETHVEKIAACFRRGQAQGKRTIGR
ncbi:hypothetical protein RBA41_08090 [Massilia sp. CCM 9210]|uniref:hypothetical protein n=1 Tax=Massilia scottii TaxID=3057166 RepID=UPI0027965DC2|nr:hypothetical protein [Massilia sp. CCM 9210]MDQ1813261.1 hypothetical protein [Massilia sp. CCM 9210]